MLEAPMHPPDPAATHDQARTRAEHDSGEKPVEQRAQRRHNWGERWLARAMAVAALSTGLNALIQALKVLIEYYFRRG
jgi:hypothetical protein